MLATCVKTVASSPVIAAHVLFHSTFSDSHPPMSLSSSQLTSNSQISAATKVNKKLVKLEGMLNVLGGALDKFDSLDACSGDPIFRFLAHFMDILAYCVSVSLSTSTAQSKTSPQTIEEQVEKLLVTQLFRQPLLISLFSPGEPLAFLESGHSLLPTFSVPVFNRYPAVLFKLFTTITGSTLGKVFGKHTGRIWKTTLLQNYIYFSQLVDTASISTNFRVEVENWMCDWLRVFGVEGDIAEKYASLLDDTSLVHQTLLENTKST